MYNIICYFHICQKTHWQKSFDMIFDRIKSSSLYEQTHEIRLGVVYDNQFTDDARFHDPKMSIIHQGPASAYERPTLLHIKTASLADPSNTLYYYVHTKGLQHFDTPRESHVLDWIKLMLYWNIERWQLAMESVTKEEYWTYGCNFTGIHYSGNFWWSKKSHIARLSNTIPDYYTAPEDWVTMLYYGCYEVPIHREYFSVFNSGLEGMGHYDHPYPEHHYRLVI